MPKFANFVQCTLVSAITIGATTIEVEAQAPFNLPPNPGGEKAFLTLMDDVNNPTAFEIISYTGTSSTGANAVELTGVTRAEQGTVAQAWDAGDAARQDLTAQSLGLLDIVHGEVLVASEDTNLYSVNKDGLFTLVWGESDDELIGVASVPGGGAWVLAGADRLVLLDNNFNVVFDITLPENSVSVSADGIGNAYVEIEQSSTQLTAVSKYKISDGSNEWTTTAVAGSGRVGVDIVGNVFYLDGASAVNNILRETNETEYWSVSGASLVKFGISYTNEKIYVAGGATESIIKIDYGGTSETIDLNNADIFAAFDSYGLYDGSLALFMPDQTIFYYTSDLVLDRKTVLPTVMADLVFLRDKSSIGRAPNIDPTLIKHDIDGNEIYFSPAPNQAFINDISAIDNSVVFADGFEYASKFPRFSEVAGIPGSEAHAVFREAEFTGTPPSGKCYVFLDSADGAFKVKFDTGTVKTIVSP